MTGYLYIFNFLTFLLHKTNMTVIFIKEASDEKSCKCAEYLSMRLGDQPSP